MKLYLSSYELGSAAGRLKAMTPHDKIAYIPNARDYSNVDPERRINRDDHDTSALRALGLEVELVDLRRFFGRPDALRGKLETIGAIFISGGNVFILRQAMRLSGLDDILTGLRRRPDFLYAGYSAAGCVLAPSLKGYEIVDPVETPYAELDEIIWEGLGLLDFAFVPHWKSDHPESAAVDQVIEFCRRHDVGYRALRDGEVLIDEI